MGTLAAIRLLAIAALAAALLGTPHRLPCRAVIEQLYTPEAINAVLQEWGRSVGSLPAIIRQSVQLGLFSSAQLVRFLSMDVRPSMTRTVTRSLPPSVGAGRMRCLTGSGVPEQALHRSRLTP